MVNDTFYMVYGGLCSSPKYRHPSYQSAVLEAERLCSMHSAEFFVLKAITKVEKLMPFTHTELTEIPF